MILPNKHLNFSESLLGLGGILLELIDKPISVNELLDSFNKINNSDKCPAFHTIDNVILALNFLYVLKIIEMDQNNKIYATYKFKS